MRARAIMGWVVAAVVGFVTVHTPIDDIERGDARWLFGFAALWPLILFVFLIGIVAVWISQFFRVKRN